MTNRTTTVNNSTGANDFDQNPASNPTSPLIDVGEAANHNLMGGGGQSRAGRWFWATGFETNGLAELSVIGASIVITTTRVWQGLYALALKTSAVINNQCIVLKNFLGNNSPSGRWGIEAMVAFENMSEVFEMALLSDTLANTAEYVGSIRVYIPAAASGIVLQYINSAFTWTTFASPGAEWAVGSSGTGLVVYHSIKLVVDFTTRKYVRAIVDGVTYDLSSQNLWNNTGVAVDTRQAWGMYLTTLAAAIATVLVDNVVLTADEP